MGMDMASPHKRGRNQTNISFLFLFPSAAEPHSSISHEEFYKHIEGEQMENARMKQLLSWCGRRALDSLQATTAANDSDGSARHIGESDRGGMIYIYITAILYGQLADDLGL